MSDKINQDSINKALWNACDTFRGTISADTYKDFILTMLFLKYISDVWQDHYDGYKAEYGDEPELIEEMNKYDTGTLFNSVQSNIEQKMVEKKLSRAIDKDVKARKEKNK